ncbi:hypothetical protein D9757_014960 [Collybiopsis confluens]|uniref:Uncharacterized protein n=1 Tax=Collybiopsis confluens TaxID=2823264 RepID=A0A8H5D5C7_9AGAR|nr:hypothetical protein D9757_014960 [Collybiopsis confluens]
MLSASRSEPLYSLGDSDPKFSCQFPLAPSAIVFRRFRPEENGIFGEFGTIHRFVAWGDPSYHIGRYCQDALEEEEERQEAEEETKGDGHVIYSTEGEGEVRPDATR